MENQTIKIEGLYDAAYRAYSGISFTPEKRAESTVLTYEKELNDDLKQMSEPERERYIAGYKKHLFAWLGALSRCLSPMITGPARFPGERNRRAMETENRRSVEFQEWRTKALKSIARKIENSKPEDQKTSEKWECLKREITQKIAWGSVANTYSMIERLAHNGEVELVEKSIDLITDYNNTHERPFMTARHKVWGLPEIARTIREKMFAKQTMESDESLINGVRVIKNHQIDRIQLFFDGKPSNDTISALKSSAFKWSPSNGCWQRQLTQNAISASHRILNNYVSL